MCVCASIFQILCVDQEHDDMIVKEDARIEKELIVAHLLNIVHPKTIKHVDQKTVKIFITFFVRTFIKQTLMSNL